MIPIIFLEKMPSLLFIQITPTQFSLAPFKLNDNETEKLIVRRVVRQNFPHLVTLFNTSQSGNKNLSGLKELIEQAYGDPAYKNVLKFLEGKSRHVDN